MQDFVLDIEEVDRLIRELPLRGVKGTTGNTNTGLVFALITRFQNVHVHMLLRFILHIQSVHFTLLLSHILLLYPGTQATFLELFNGDHSKVQELDKLVCQKMGFQKSIFLSGQTYTRKLDYKVLSALSEVGQSAQKMCTDIRLLASMKEIEEPFGKQQIGSSAMAYKRNPMRSERVCSLARYLLSLPINAANTHASQWFERTLDDSAIRRIVLPEAFLTTDVILTTLIDIADGLVVWPGVISKHINDELPFMATEVILMQCVKAGGDRQVLHEAIREHSMLAGRKVKEEGQPNDLLERVAKDPLFASVHSTLGSLLDPRLFIGRAPEQVDDFVLEVVDPLLSQHAALLSKKHSDVVNV
ncbi:hypothetical protein EON65_02960 [archaeon]|nr:MAG: hypothetical protein EON65_02960 [archaeon]